MQCVAWGELGLDNHYDRPPRSVQDPVLEEHLAFIEAQAKTGLRKPIVIHCREAFDDLIPILHQCGAGPLFARRFRALRLAFFKFFSIKKRSKSMLHSVELLRNMKTWQ